MKYSDRQRVKKIYDYAVRLQEYILENRIKKRGVTDTVAVAVACHNAAI